MKCQIERDVKIVVVEKVVKQPAPDPAKIAADLAAKKVANQRLAQRFFTNLTAEQTRLTFEKYPYLEDAYNGEFSGNLDLRKIEVVTPQMVDKYAGDAAERRLYDARKQKQRAEFEQSGGYLTALGKK